MSRGSTRRCGVSNETSWRSFGFFLICRTSPGQEQAKESAPVQATSLCAVIADAAKYDGREVVVSGLYRMVIHGTILVDRSCSKIYVNLRQSPGYKADKEASALLRSLSRKDQFRPVDVVFRGTFRVAHDEQCFGQICASYEIETAELITARPAAP